MFLIEYNLCMNLERVQTKKLKTSFSNTQTNSVRPEIFLMMFVENDWKKNLLHWILIS